jgi:hypothetical protein
VTDVTATDQRDPSVREVAPDAPRAREDPSLEAEAAPAPQPSVARGGRASIGRDGNAPLFDDAAAGELRATWGTVQASFVDEPRSAVEQADALVAEVMKRLADTFGAERKSLEMQWSKGDDVSTEELRLALRRYRSFFDRLLSI